MALGGKIGVAVARYFALVALAVFTVTTSLSLTIRTAGAADIAALIKSLDRTEWEIVREEVGKRLPDLIATKDEQESFKKMLQTSQQAAAFAQAYQSGNYTEAQKIATKYLADNLEQAVAVRFGTDSPIYRSIQVLKKDGNRDLAAKLTKAALDVDPTGAKTAIQDYLTEHARTRFKKLQAQGEKFWKDMLLEIVPGGNKLASYGFNPVDIYLRQVKDFTKFTTATKKRFNNTALDCLALRYRKLLSAGNTEADAVQMIQDTGTGPALGSDFKCSEELDKRDGTLGEKSVTQQVVDFFRNLGTTTAATGQLNLRRDEIAKLLPLYVKEGAWEKRRDEFSEWLEARLVSKIKNQADNLTEAIGAEQKRVAAERRSEMNNVLTTIEAEIAKLDRDKPDSEDPSDKDRPVAGKGRENSDTSGHAADKSKDKKKPKPEKVTVQCERLSAVVARSRRASASESAKIMAELQSAVAAAKGEGNCGADVFASADSVRDRLQKVSTMRDRLQAAIRSCDVDALPQLKSEAASLGTNAFDGEITLLQTASTGVSQFKNGKSAFDAGNYAGAKGPLQRARSAFRELPSGSCQTFADRTQSGLDQVEKILAQKVIVDRAIVTCDVDGMKKLIEQYRNRKYAFFRESIGRIRVALPKCEKKDRIIAEGKFCQEMKGRVDGASADFKANRLKDARQKLVALNKELTPSNTKRCSDLPGRVRQGLANLDTIKSEYERFARAEQACDIDMLKMLMAQYRRKKHPWFARAVTRARGMIKDCEKKREQETAAKFCKEMRRRVDAASDDFKANRLKAAKASLSSLNSELSASNTKDCSELPGRVRQGLSQLDAINTFYGRLKQAANKCDVQMLNMLVTRFRQEHHLWFKKAASLGSDRIEECQNKPPTREEAIADCRRQVAAKGKVYAKTRFKPDGSYSCHWCERGQVSNGSACVTDTAAAEADCRRQAAAKGKVYAKTHIRNDGRYNCYWCERGQSFVNGKCWSAAQIADAKCRQDVARRGKVFGRVEMFANGKYRCHWCEPGQQYANGRCYSRQQVQPRAQPQPRRANCGYLPAPCHVDMSGTATGAARERACRARNAQAAQRYTECMRRGR